jgi:PAS domain S-box-containing protein
MDEDVLQGNEPLDQQQMEAIPDGVVVYDNQGKVRYVNQIFVKTYGWSKEELLGRPIHFVPPMNWKTPAER